MHNGLTGRGNQIGGSVPRAVSPLPIKARCVFRAPALTKYS